MITMLDIDRKIELRFWQVHAGAVEDVVVLNERVLSCGQDGAIHEYHLTEQSEFARCSSSPVFYRIYRNLSNESRKLIPTHRKLQPDFSGNKASRPIRCIRYVCSRTTRGCLQLLFPSWEFSMDKIECFWKPSSHNTCHPSGEHMESLMFFSCLVRKLMIIWCVLESSRTDGMSLNYSGPTRGK